MEISVLTNYIKSSCIGPFFEQKFSDSGLFLLVKAFLFVILNTTTIEIIVAANLLES